MAFLSAAVFSQSEKYIKAMESKVVMLDSNISADGWKELANSFERIAEAEKTLWEPYYYASFCTVMAGNFSMPQGSFGDNSSISDPIADKAEQLLNKAMEISKDNSELYCVKKMIHSLRMMGNVMSRYQTELPSAEAALAKAKELNENNPRVYILQGQDKFYTPEQFGGSKEEAKTLFEKAQGIFMVSKPGSSIEPQWGRGQVMYFLSQLK
jgi:tetratricopeptide (TPR) repeat protein